MSYCLLSCEIAGVEISLCGHVLRAGMGRESAEEAFQQHLVCEEDFKSSGVSIVKIQTLLSKLTISISHGVKFLMLFLGRLYLVQTFA